MSSASVTLFIILYLLLPAFAASISQRYIIGYGASPFSPYGQSSGAAISTADALQGRAYPSDNTITNGEYGSIGYSSYNPSHDDIGYSSNYNPSHDVGYSNYNPSYDGVGYSRYNTQYDVPAVRGPQQPDGFGGSSIFSPGQSAGTAVGTAGALQGLAFSSGNTLTHGGFSNSLANGRAEGLQPATTSIANGQSSGGFGEFPPYPFGQSAGAAIGTVGEFPLFPAGQSSGAAIGTANALQGLAFSSGNTMTHGGFSNTLAQGQAEGLHPATTSIANSQSSRFKRRRRRNAVV